MLAHVVCKWASFHNRPLYMVGDEDPAFQTIVHIPDEMPRHEKWRLQYRREPYLKHLSNDELRDAFDEVILVTSLWGLKGSPIKVNMEDSMVAMERFTHIQIEMHERALPMERFDYEFDRELAAAARLKLPKVAIDWLQELNDERMSGR